MRLERGLKGRDQLLKLVERETGQIQELRGAVLHVRELYMRHTWCLLVSEAQYTINRDNLNCVHSYRRRSAVLPTSVPNVLVGFWPYHHRGIHEDIEPLDEQRRHAEGLEPFLIDLQPR